MNINDIKAAIDELVAIIKKMIADMGAFIDGFKTHLKNPMPTEPVSE